MSIDDKLEFLQIAYKDIDNVSEEEYIDIRMDWLGASDSSKLLNVNPFPNGTNDDLVYEKATKHIDESINKKASVRMGKDVEHIILAKLQNYFTDYQIDKPKNMYCQPDTHLSCNFDAVAIIGENKIIPIEIKTVTKYGRKYYDFSKATFNQKDGEWQEPQLDIKYNNNILETDYQSLADMYGIPVYYYTQLQQQMYFLDSNIGYLAVLDADNWDVHIFKIYINKTLWQELKETAIKTWAKVKAIRSLKENKKA